MLKKLIEEGKLEVNGTIPSDWFKKQSYDSLTFWAKQQKGTAKEEHLIYLVLEGIRYKIKFQSHKDRFGFTLYMGW